MLSPRANAERKYTAARNSLLMALVFTVINVVGAILNSEYYFLFSAFMPYIVAALGEIGRAHV